MPMTRFRGYETADDRADDAKHDVHEHARSGLVDDLARDEPGDQTKNDPGDYRPFLNPPLAPPDRRGMCGMDGENASR